MDFEYTPEQDAFRKELRGWLAANLPRDLCVDDPADDRVAPDRATFERFRSVSWPFVERILVNFGQQVRPGSGT